MTTFKSLMILMILIFRTTIAHAQYYNEVKIYDYSVQLSKVRSGYITVASISSGQNFSCKISNWDERLSKGGGMISLTSDKIGVLLYPGRNYLKTSELLGCNNNSIKTYDIPDPDGKIDSVADANFDKKVFLSLYLIDVNSSAYQAKVSKFGEKSNLLKGSGFWNESVKTVNKNDDAFSVIDDFYVGKISQNGKYVAPNDLDCSVDSFPGVWDIEKKKKVVFISDKDDKVIDDKCQAVFSGKKTLEELGGALIQPN